LTVPGIGPIISSAMVAAIGTGEAQALNAALQREGADLIDDASALKIRELPLHGVCRIINDPNADSARR
jgi:hypothetical protein